MAIWDGSKKINAGAETTVKDKTTRDSLDRTIGGREAIYKDVVALDARRGLDKSSALTYMYSDSNSSIVKIAGKNSFRDEAYNESLNVSAAGALSERASAKGGFISRFAIKPGLFATLSNEDIRKVEYNLNYSLLSKLDEKAFKTALSLGKNVEEQQTLYSELKHRYFQDYAKWQEKILENPGKFKTTEEAIDYARKLGISEEVIQTSQEIYRAFGALSGAKTGIKGAWNSTLGKPVSETLQYWKEEGPKGLKEIKNAIIPERDIKELDQIIKSILVRSGFRVPEK